MAKTLKATSLAGAPWVGARINIAEDATARAEAVARVAVLLSGQVPGRYMALGEAVADATALVQGAHDFKRAHDRGDPWAHTLAPARKVARRHGAELVVKPHRGRPRVRHSRIFLSFKFRQPRAITEGVIAPIHFVA
jgi:hypothetical protein